MTDWAKCVSDSMSSRAIWSRLHPGGSLWRWSPERSDHRSMCVHPWTQRRRLWTRWAECWKSKNLLENNLFIDTKNLKLVFLCLLCFVIMNHISLIFLNKICVWPQAALQAGLGQTATNAVIAVMEDCVTLKAVTAPVAWAGLVNAATQVQHF